MTIVKWKKYARAACSGNEAPKEEGQTTPMMNLPVRMLLAKCCPRREETTLTSKCLVQKLGFLPADNYTLDGVVSIKWD